MHSLWQGRVWWNFLLERDFCLDGLRCHGSHKAAFDSFSVEAATDQDASALFCFVILVAVLFLEIKAGWRPLVEGRRDLQLPPEPTVSLRAFGLVAFTLFLSCLLVWPGQSEQGQV